MVSYRSIYNGHSYISYNPKELDSKPAFVASVFSPQTIGNHWQ